MRHKSNKSRASHRDLYRSPTFTRAGRFAIIVIIGVWEWACVSSTSTTTDIVRWTAINAVLAVAADFRLRKMGLVATEDGLLLRYFWYRRMIAWGEIANVDIKMRRGRGMVYLWRRNGREVMVPGIELLPEGAKDGWLHTHRIAWPGGESSDPMGTLRDLVAAHQGASDNVGV